MNRIFILASERSGSNLLRTLLGKHKNIEAPIAPHFLDFFIPRLRLYGSFSNKKNIKKLTKHFLINANHEFNNWNIKQNEEYIVKKYHPKSILDIFDALYVEKTHLSNKLSYCSKGIHTFNYVPILKENFPNAKFIYLYRDPRDHTASWMRTPLFMHSPYQIISKWNQEQNKCIMLKYLYPNSIISVAYEHLIQDTKREIDKILNFIGEEFDSNCYSTNPNNVEANKNLFWKNLSKPILSNNSNKYNEILSNYDIQIIESISKKNMIELGYTNFNTKAEWSNENSFLFKLRNKVKIVKTKFNNRKIYKEKMTLLHSKLQMQSNISKELDK